VINIITKDQFPHVTKGCKGKNELGFLVAHGEQFSNQFSEALVI
jgi:hypothetical protein